MKLSVTPFSIARVLLAAVAGCTLFEISSCARTMGGPLGGPKDTIPPVVVATMPEYGTTDFPRTKGKVTIKFNEYIQLKEPAKNIFLSPPTKKRPEYKIKGKSLVFTFPDTLLPNQTYSLDWGGAVADNNEGNPIGPYSFAFSTGSTIDSMLLSGRVYDNEKLVPMADVSVLLYDNPSDSCVYNSLPIAMAKSDKWGYFCIKNIKEKDYAIYAIKDESGNNKYDRGSEMIGFPEARTIRPKVVMRDSLPQLAFYDQKDTLKHMSRPLDIELFLFKEGADIQYIKEHTRISNKSFYIKFNAPYVKIDSFEVTGIPQHRIISQFNARQDSLVCWINIPRILPDTLLLSIKYDKSDSLGKLVPTTEKLKLMIKREKKDDSSNGNNTSARNRQQQQQKKKNEESRSNRRKDYLEMKLKADADMIEQNGWVFEFPEPLVYAAFDTISFTSKTPRGVVSKVPFTVTRNKNNIKEFILKPDIPLKKGNEYEMIVYKKIFKDVNGNSNDSTYSKIMLPSDDKLSSLELEVKGVNGTYAIELVNESRSQLFRRYTVEKDTTLLFPYLKSGKYSIRISEDKNGNDILDPGDVIKYVQPEKVKLFKLENGKEIIIIPERTDLTQTLDIDELFNAKKKE